jgi:hypothetical protein
MGGIVGKNKKELEREEELRKMQRARLAIFNKPPEPESSDDEGYNSEEREPQQFALTENNVKVNSRKISSAVKNVEEEVTPPVGKVDGPSHILDDRMMKVLEFMLDPDFNKVSAAALLPVLSILIL